MKKNIKPKKRKEKKQIFNRNGILIQTDRPPRQRVFPGEKVREDYR